MRRRRFMGLSLAALAGCRARPPTPTTTAYTGPATATNLIVLGRVLTLDPQKPEASAVAVGGGRILAVGERDGILQTRRPDTTVLDLGEGLVTPGLVDAHAHLLGLGQSLEEIDLRGAASIEQVIERIRQMDRGQPWLTGRGWDQNLWSDPDKAMPTHHPLTKAFPDRPVWLRRIDGHAGWANAAALTAAGIGNDRANPPGGEILRDASGTATGVLVDAAMDFISPPEATAEDIRRRLRAAQAHVLARGLTGIHDMGVGPATDAVYRELLTADDPDTRLALRVLGYADASWLPTLATERKPERPGPDDLYALVGVKLYADGALGSRGAALLDPYHDRPDHRGLMQQSPAMLLSACELAVGGGWQVATHAIGDAAIRTMIDTYASVLKRHGATDARLRIEHAQIVAVQDIPRFAEHGIIASMQPTHATSDMPWVPDRLGPKRLAGAYAWRRFLDAGVHLCFGSDFPVELVDVTHGLYAAVTRQDDRGSPPEGWLPDQRLSLTEAIAAFSRDAAFAGFCESFGGMIKEGYRADLTAFRDDLRTLDPTELRDAAIAATIVAGRVRYRA